MDEGFSFGFGAWLRWPLLRVTAACTALSGLCVPLLASGWSLEVRGVAGRAAPLRFVVAGRAGRDAAMVLRLGSGVG
ncbi:MAG: hypothetical protein ACRDHX_06600 [Chloroflexota bacterium]